jgi:tetratricopeptide (TPR) repeat protein
MALHQAAQLDAASTALERAVALDAGFAQAWFRLGLVRQDLGQLDLAATAFRTALACRADYAEAAVNLGIVLQDKGDLDGALQSYRHAVHLRADTLGRIAQALTAASNGRLWLDPRELRRQLQDESFAVDR